MLAHDSKSTLLIIDYLHTREVNTSGHLFNFPNSQVNSHDIRDSQGCSPEATVNAKIVFYLWLIRKRGVSSLMLKVLSTSLNEP